MYISMTINRPPVLYQLRANTHTSGTYGLFRKWKSPYEAFFFPNGIFPWADRYKGRWSLCTNHIESGLATTVPSSGQGNTDVSDEPGDGVGQRKEGVGQTTEGVGLVTQGLGFRVQGLGFRV